MRKRMAGRQKGHMIVCSQFSFSRFCNGGAAGEIREPTRMARKSDALVIRNYDGVAHRKFSSACIFSLHAEAALVFCECELAPLTSGASSGQRQLRTRSRRLGNESEGRPRRTRVKIEFFIAPCHLSFPRDPNGEKKSRQTHPLAVACSGLLGREEQRVPHSPRSQAFRERLKCIRLTGSSPTYFQDVACYDRWSSHK